MPVGVALVTGVPVGIVFVFLALFMFVVRVLFIVLVVFVVLVVGIALVMAIVGSVRVSGIAVFVFNSPVGAGTSAGREDEREYCGNQCDENQFACFHSGYDLREFWVILWGVFRACA